HWKYSRLCRPERKMKCPSSSAPVFRKTAIRSSFMKGPFYMEGRAPATLLRRLIEFASPLWVLTRRVIRCLSRTPIRHGNNFDFHIHGLGQRCHLDGRTGWSILLEIRAVNFVNGLEITKVRKENRCLHHMVEG